jgi:hypothetical protein
MRTIAVVTVWMVALALTGCPAPPNSLARAQQTAQEFNLDSRLGHGELSLDRVAPDAREQYRAQHRAWGTSVRVVDVEILGMKAQGERDVQTLVRVAWYRPEDEELRSTTVEQSWSDKAAGWQLVLERRVEGEMGLLGEPVLYQSPDARRPTQFPTVRLTGNVSTDSE